MILWISDFAALVEILTGIRWVEVDDSIPDDGWRNSRRDEGAFIVHRTSGGACPSIFDLHVLFPGLSPSNRIRPTETVLFDRKASFLVTDQSGILHICHSSPLHLQSHLSSRCLPGCHRPRTPHPCVPAKNRISHYANFGKCNKAYSAQKSLSTEPFRSACSALRITARALAVIATAGTFPHPGSVLSKMPQKTPTSPKNSS